MVAKWKNTGTVKNCLRAGAPRKNISQSCKKELRTTRKYLQRRFTDCWDISYLIELSEMNYT